MRFLKSEIFYHNGRSPLGQLAILVNLIRLKLSYQFQTLHDDSYNNEVQLGSVATV